MTRGEDVSLMETPEERALRVLDSGEIHFEGIAEWIGADQDECMARAVAAIAAEIRAAENAALERVAFWLQRIGHIPESGYVRSQKSGANR